MEHHDFRISDEILAKRTKGIYIAIITLPIFMLVVAYFMAWRDGMDKLKLLLIIFGIASVLLDLELFLINRIFLKKMKESIFYVYQDRLVLSNSRFNDVVLFSELEGLKIVRCKNGSLMMLKLFSRSKNMNISGFENMEYILDLIKGYAPELCNIQEKPQKMDADNPLTIIICILIAIILTIAILYFGDPTYVTLCTLLMLGLGLYTLIYRPNTRNYGSRFKIFEILCSLLLIVLGTLSLISQFR